MRAIFLLVHLVLAAGMAACGGGLAIGPDTPAVIDEVEAFETRIAGVLPADWTMERLTRRPAFRVGPAASTPYVDDLDRSWFLSTPWPGHEPQRVNVVLHLVRDVATVPAHFEILGRWERFAVAAEDPAAVQIGGMSFTWTTLPGWPNARDEIKASLAP